MWFLYPKMGNLLFFCGNFSKHLLVHLSQIAYGLNFDFILETNFAMIYVSLFILLIAVIAVVTNQLNAKTPCDHNWEEHDNSFKCCKCGKKIPNYIAAYNDTYRESFSEAA